MLDGLEGATTVEEIVSGAAGALWQLIERDERLPRVYFDLNAVSVVDSDIRDVLREIKRAWREVVSRLLREADPPVAERDVGAVTTLIIAGLEGLTLERIERGETPELDEARELFVRSVCADRVGPERPTTRRRAGARPRARRRPRRRRARPRRACPRAADARARSPSRL